MSAQFWSSMATACWWKHCFARPSSTMTRIPYPCHNRFPGHAFETMNRKATCDGFWQQCPRVYPLPLCVSATILFSQYAQKWWDKRRITPAKASTQTFLTLDGTMLIGSCDTNSTTKHAQKECENLLQLQTLQPPVFVLFTHQHPS